MSRTGSHRPPSWSGAWPRYGKREPTWSTTGIRAWVTASAWASVRAPKDGSRKRFASGRSTLVHRTHCYKRVQTPYSKEQLVSKIASVFVTSLLIAAAVSTSVRSQTPQTVQSQSLADGKRLYGVNCANCHGARAQGAVKAGIEISIITERGGKQPPDLTDPAWDHGSTDAGHFHRGQERHSLGMMAPYEGRLSDVEIRNVVAYVRSLSSPQAATTGPHPRQHQHGRQPAPAPRLRNARSSWPTTSSCRSPATGQPIASRGAGARQHPA